MSDRVPERLWKYRQWGEHARSLIVHGEVYFAKRAELNDPLEFRWREKFPRKPSEIDEYARGLCQLHYPNDTIVERRVHYSDLKAELIRLSAEQRNGSRLSETVFNLGVFSVSELPDDLLMWSHHAANHSGVCLGIRTDAMKAKLFLPVNYTEQLPVIDIREYIQRIRGLFVRLSLTKSAHWSYEKEWRTIYLPGPRRFAGCVDTVVVGLRATEKTRSEVRAAIAEAAHHIETLDARLSQTHYALDLARPTRANHGDRDSGVRANRSPG